MIAVILSGGHGTRLKPLTDHTPKSLIEVNGKPILEYLLSACKDARQIYAISDRKKPVRSWLEKHAPHVNIVDQTEPNGTGSAVYPCLQYAGVGYGEGLMVLLGDIIPIDFNFAESCRNVPTVSKIGVCPAPDPTQCAVVEIDKDGYYSGHTEKPDAPSHQMSMAGWWYFRDAQLFQSIQQSMMTRGIKNDRGEFDILQTIQTLYDYNEQFLCLLTNILDCGTHGGLAAAERHFQNERNADGK